MTHYCQYFLITTGLFACKKGFQGEAMQSCKVERHDSSFYYNYNQLLMHEVVHGEILTGSCMVSHAAKTVHAVRLTSF